MKTTLYILCCAFGLAVAGCQKYIEFDAEVKEPKLVINTLFEEDTAWSVHLSHSLSVIDNGDLDAVTDATVVIKDGNGNTVEQLTHDGEGYYVGATFPVQGNTYTVEASAPGYTSVSATDYVPVAVPIIAVDTLREFVNDGYSIMKVTFTLNDPQGIENFYQVRISAKEFNGVDTFDNFWYFSSTDPIFDNIGNNESWATYGLFRDVLFDGETRSFSIDMDTWLFDNGDRDLEIVLISTTEANNNYRRTYETYQSTSGSPFAQPVQVYSNVEGGFGLFAGQSRFIWTL